jgi:hypothetical protein
MPSPSPDVFGTITTLFNQVTTWFKSVFEMITSAEMLPWVLLGVGISLLGVLTKFARKLIWGA